MKNLDIIDESPSYSTLVVLPTGGGKTYTASMWLLRHALNNHKKILWIAHRQMLLDQAAESFQKYAYAENLPNVSSFSYRIVSGSTSHDRTKDIVPGDNLLIASKDSIGRNMEALDKWLNGDDEIYLVIDEAHHSTAKTYRKIIDHVKEKVKNTKVIGLTATPLRTAANEQGLLAKLFTDGVRSGRAVSGDIGITYQIGLKDLINRGILSKPIFESRYTDEAFGDNLGLDDWEKIEEFAAILDDSVDTTAIERVPFEQRVPIGMYAFTYLEENGMDHSYQVMVYDSTQEAYHNMMEALPDLFKAFKADEEFLSETTLHEMADQIRDTYFLGEMIPPYEEKDVIQVLKYFAQYEEPPKFYTFDYVDKSKLDVAAIARHIWDEDMGPRKKAEYVESLWEEGDDNMLRLFFGRKAYFWKQLDIEMIRYFHSCTDARYVRYVSDHPRLRKRRSQDA